MKIWAINHILGQLPLLYEYYDISAENLGDPVLHAWERETIRVEVGKRNLDCPRHHFTFSQDGRLLEVTYICAHSDSPMIESKTLPLPPT